MFFDAMHGSTVTGASNAEPHLRTESSIAAMKTLRFADKGSFSASKNKYSPSPAAAFLIVFIADNLLSL